MLSEKLKHIFDEIESHPIASQDSFFMDLTQIIRQNIEIGCGISALETPEESAYEGGQNQPAPTEDMLSDFFGDEEKAELVDYKGKQIVRSEYEALEELVKNAGLDMDNIAITDDFSCYDFRNTDSYTINSTISIEKNHIIGLKVVSSSLKDLKAVEKLPLLQALDLNGNQISEIEGLRGLKKLLYLDLSGNNISKIEGFDDLENLRHLRLSNNNISKLEGLDNLTKLEMLFMPCNFIDQLEGLQNLKNLRYANLSLNGIGKLEGLKGLSKLEGIDLDRNIIHEIEGNALEGLDSLKAVWILNHNSIGPESPGMGQLHRKKVLQDYCAAKWDRRFNWYLARMAQYLGVDFDDFEIVDSFQSYFDKKQVLEKSVDEDGQVVGLRIEGYQIPDMKLFSSLTNLETLCLLNNNIAKIEGLEKLTNLDYICISNNQIEKIEGLDCLKKLHYLSLSGNKISRIEGLEQLDNLDTINLCLNNISKIEGLNGLKKLATIWLVENQISKLEGLEDLENLRELYMACNRIQQITGLENLKNLRKLAINSNDITCVEGLDKLPGLEEVYLDESQTVSDSDLKLKIHVTGPKKEPGTEPKKPEPKKRGGRRRHTSNIIDLADYVAEIEESEIDDKPFVRPKELGDLTDEGAGSFKFKVFFDDYKEPKLTLENLDDLIRSASCTAQEMREPSEIRKLVSALSRIGRANEALGIFTRIRIDDRLLRDECYRDMISGISKEGDAKAALGLADNIEHSGIKINAYLDIANDQIDRKEKRAAQNTLKLAKEVASGLRNEYEKNAIIHSPETEDLPNDYQISADASINTAYWRLKECKPRPKKSLIIPSFVNREYEKRIKDAPELEASQLKKVLEKINKSAGYAYKNRQFLNHAFGQIKKGIKESASELLELARETIPLIVKDCNDLDNMHIYQRATADAQRYLSYAYALNGDYENSDKVLDEIDAVSFPDIKSRGRRDLSVVLGKHGHFDVAMSHFPHITNSNHALDALLGISEGMIAQDYFENAFHAVNLAFNFIKTMKSDIDPEALMDRYVAVILYCKNIKEKAAKF